MGIDAAGAAERLLFDVTLASEVSAVADGSLEPVDCDFERDCELVCDRKTGRLIGAGMEGVAYPRSRFLESSSDEASYVVEVSCGLRRAGPLMPKKESGAVCRPGKLFVRVNGARACIETANPEPKYHELSVQMSSGGSTC
eukprot:m51a1_g8736 hypothetical protein (141) ;mRNA; r:24827-25635